MARWDRRKYLIAASFALVWATSMSASLLGASAASAQSVTDKSDAAIGKADTRTILDLIKANIKEADGSKVTELRRSKGAIVCGSLNVKNKDGKFLGERGFVVDLSKKSFGRLAEGPDLTDPRAPGFAEKEAIRALYFDMCLD